jgi:hypothetical protein
MENKQEYKYIGECKGNNDNGCFMESPGYDCGCYKRVQQEEPKQETTGKKFYESADVVITVSKQETFEEVANNWIKNTSEFLSVKNGFVAGAKWQARRMYSEEEVETIAKDAYNMGKNNILIGVFNKWFEQYKKK